MGWELIASSVVRNSPLASESRLGAGRYRGKGPPLKDRFGFEGADAATEGAGLVEIRDSIRGGRGVFAAKAFITGQRVFAESPFISIPGVTELPGNPHNEWHCLAHRTPLSQDSVAASRIREVVQSLCPSDQETFWGFSQATTVYGSSVSAHGVFYTNYVDVTTSEGVETGCMFRRICRVNHSCDPNVSWRYYHADRQLVLVSTRDIKQGEELLVDYCGHSDEWEGTERRDHLSLFYGFDCECPICAGAPSAQPPKNNSAGVCPT